MAASDTNVAHSALHPTLPSSAQHPPDVIGGDGRPRLLRRWLDETRQQLVLPQTVLLHQCCHLAGLEPKLAVQHALQRRLGAAQVDHQAALLARAAAQQLRALRGAVRGEGV